LPKASQKPNNSKNPLRDHDSILTIDNNIKNDWDPLVYIQSVSEPKPKVCRPTQHSDVCDLWESGEEDVYETQGGFWLDEKSDEDF